MSAERLIQEAIRDGIQEHLARTGIETYEQQEIWSELGVENCTPE